MISVKEEIREIPWYEARDIRRDRVAYVIWLECNNKLLEQVWDDISDKVCANIRSHVRRNHVLKRRRLK